ncbi:hypothetical protein like AT2G05260 [Hibiscus trionum]|uniref:Fungal lipase-type domain-containing protein n=1 Tax=Hibiscus trionum TaxID=183268 RepID=A0A9W7I4L3_HIBTR|nr:hypothetical protein like AT2G05260 [Hibiscus trionum]
MASGSEDFNHWGPKHLSSVDWHNAEHRRSVSACLVKGAYVLESDRQETRGGSQCLAPPWWEAFNFKLVYQLVDDVDDSIFGAIFEYNPPAYTYHRSPDRSPQYVFAFRGTVKKERSFSRDLDLNLGVVLNGLHESSRFKTAMKAVQDVVSVVGCSNVWLTGHSQGASTAMLAGKNMAKRGSFLEAYLFNPPFVSAPIERVKDGKLRHGLRFAGTLIKAGLAFAAADHNNSKGIEDSFTVISGWIPCLFVNPLDPICAEYIGYFEHRRKLEDMGAGKLARLTSQHSLGNIAMNAVGLKGFQTSEPLHLLPSANLTVNLSSTRDLSKDHGINQWWRPDLNLSCRVYKY